MATLDKAAIDGGLVLEAEDFAGGLVRVGLDHDGRYRADFFDGEGDLLPENGVTLSYWPALLSFLGALPARDDWGPVAFLGVKLL